MSNTVGKQFRRSFDEPIYTSAEPLRSVRSCGNFLDVNQWFRAKYIKDVVPIQYCPLGHASSFVMCLVTFTLHVGNLLFVLFE